MANAIEFDHVGKQYRLGLVSTKTLSHDLDRWWQTSVLKKEDPYLKIGEINDRAVAGSSEYVWALHDISFNIEQGDVVGIIGRNGAGKSTLLKLLSKVTGPTVGTIRARGRIGALLEVGTGFHPEMTGRENIYMNGAIMGMSKAEITSKLDEIIEFSGCERYIDTPTKRYSSGMKVRLGFAVAAHLEPEILVVDEVLAVGDAEFQKKAIGKMQEVSRGEGRTVLFVSHNMASIRALCRTGILLDKGEIAFMGNVRDTLDRYLLGAVQTEEPQPLGLRPLTTQLLINGVHVNGQDGNIVKLESDQNKLEFVIEGKTLSRLKIALEGRLYDRDGVLLGVFSPSHLKGVTSDYDGDFVLSETLELPRNINKGRYKLNIALSHPNVEFLAKGTAPILIDCDGIVGNSGLSFDYSGSGFLML